MTDLTGGISNRIECLRVNSKVRQPRGGHSIEGHWLTFAGNMKRGDRVAVRDYADAFKIMTGLQRVGNHGEAVRLRDGRRIVVNCGAVLKKDDGRWQVLLQICGMCRHGNCYLCSGKVRRGVACECGHAVMIDHYGYTLPQRSGSKVPLKPRPIDTTGKDNALTSVTKYSQKKAKGDVTG